MVMVSEPIVCPIIRDPNLGLADIREFDQLRKHLRTLRQTGQSLESTTFPRGVIELDGRLDLCKQGLGAGGAAAILPELDGSPIRHVLLGTNAIGLSGLEAVAAAIGGASVIETVYLGCNGITAESLPALSNAIIASSSVKALWLKRNPLGPKAGPLLAEMIEQSRLETIDLVATGLDDASFEPIAHAITNSQTLRHVFVAGNSFTAATIERLTDWIGGPLAESLYLSANPLGDQGAHMLANSLQQRLRPINLSMSSVGLTVASAESCGRLAHGAQRLDLGRSPMARVLGATDNWIGDDGLAAISGELHTCTLQWLDVRHCRVRDAGVQLFVDALAGDHAVERVVFGPGVSRRLKAQVRSRLRTPSGDQLNSGVVPASRVMKKPFFASSLLHIRRSANCETRQKKDFQHPASA